MTDPHTLVPLRFDSSALPEAEQFATFADAVANFDVSRPGSGAFAARALIWRVGALVIVQVTTEEATGWSRAAERIRADRADHIYVNVHYSGRFTIHSGYGVRSGGAGSLLAVDMRQPVRIDDGPMKKIYVAMPRKPLLDRLDGHDPHGLVVSGATAALLGPALRAACAALPRITHAEAPMVERMVLDLVADTLLQGLRASEGPAAREEALATRVRAYIDAHLGEDLDIATLCRALGVSRSNLYRAFGTEGGVRHQIQARRLRRVRALLLDLGETRSIAALAEATGFADKSHLTRLFRQAFGVTPGAFRRASAAPATAIAASDTALATRFSALVRELS
jgi:AraC-like DNA-binding protein